MKVMALLPGQPALNILCKAKQHACMKFSSQADACVECCAAVRYGSAACAVFWRYAQQIGSQLRVMRVRIDKLQHEACLVHQSTQLKCSGF